MGNAVRLDESARRSQAAFRAIMHAVSRPGRIERIEVSADAPLPGCMADIAIVLCDYETPVWLDRSLSSQSTVEWVRFQTGAPVVADPGAASYLFVTDTAQLPSLEGLALGTDEYPDRSATLVIYVDRLDDGAGRLLFGPGVESGARLDVGPLPESLLAERSALRELFPRGLDLIFVSGGRIAALPRTTIVGA